MTAPAGATDLTDTLVSDAPAIAAPEPATGLRVRLGAAARSGTGGPLGVALLATFLVLLSVQHLIWLHRYRSGLPLDIDEAGYLSFGLDDLEGWRDGGPAGLHEAVVDQRQFAPLVPLVATPLLAVAGDRPIGAMAVQLLFLAVLGFATLGLGRAVAGSGAGLLAAVITIVLPGVLDFARTFHFALAATAPLCAAVWALVRADGLSHRWWTLIAGAAAGAMLLARTMTIALLPGLVVAAAVQVAAAPRRTRPGRIVNLSLGAATGLLVAAWWYVPNLPVVWRYLVGAGYGDARVLYADTRAPVFSARFWTLRLSELVHQGLFLPIGAIVVVTFVVLVVTATISRRRWSTARLRFAAGGEGWRVAIRLLASPAGAVGIVLVVSYLVLTTSQIGGTGFVLPLAPLTIVLWAGALAALPWRRLRHALAGSLVLVALLGLVSKTTLSGPLAGHSCLRLPALDCAPVVDSRGVGHKLPHATWADVDPSAARRGAAGQWIRVAEEAASFAIGYAAERGVRPVVFFASRDPLFNTNTVGLAGRLHEEQVIPMGQLRPDQGGDTVANYRRRLDDPRYGWPNLLITVDRGPYEYRPVVDQAEAERAARSLGFELVHRQVLPDGRLARFFWLQRGPSLS